MDEESEREVNLRKYRVVIGYIPRSAENPYRSLLGELYTWQLYGEGVDNSPRYRSKEREK